MGIDWNEVWKDTVGVVGSVLDNPGASTPTGQQPPPSTQPETTDEARYYGMTGNQVAVGLAAAALVVAVVLIATRK